jgi:ribosomal protein L16 Arg81 hydroxylase
MVGTAPTSRLGLHDHAGAFAHLRNGETAEIRAGAMRGSFRFDLARILHPVSPAQFFAEYWEEKPLVVHRDDRDYYAALLSMEQIDPLVTVFPPDTVTVASSHDNLDTAEFARADGSLDVVKATQLFADGRTIVIQEAHKRIESLTALCRELEREIGAPFQCNLYLTPAQGKGFDTHYDTHDVLLLQVAGSKEWTIFDSPVRLPLNGQPFDPNIHPVGAPTMSFVLRAGDFLYIPRGFLHHARSADEMSLHATLGALSYRWADVIIETLAQLCLSDPAFRRALPVGFGRPEFDMAAARRTLSELLSRAAQQANLDGVLERLADEFTVGRRAYVPGQLNQAFLASQLTAADQVGVRPGTIYRLRMDGDQIRIRSHGREIVLPVDATDCVRFALENKQYCVRDIPGNLDDEDKVAIVKRLIEEGLVWKLSGR